MSWCGCYYNTFFPLTFFVFLKLCNFLGGGDEKQNPVVSLHFFVLSCHIKSHLNTEKFAKMS